VSKQAAKPAPLPPEVYDPTDCTEDAVYRLPDERLVIFSHAHEDRATTWVYCSSDGGRSTGYGLSAWREMMEGCVALGQLPGVKPRFSRCLGLPVQLRRAALQVIIDSGGLPLPHAFPVREPDGAYSISLEWEEVEVLVKLSKKEIFYEVDEEPVHSHAAVLADLKAALEES